MVRIILFILLALICLVSGLLLGSLYGKKKVEKENAKANFDATQIIENAKKEASKIKEEADALKEKTISEGKAEADILKEKAISDGKVEVDNYRLQQEGKLKQVQDELIQTENDIRERKNNCNELEEKLNLREDTLDRRSTNLDRREELLNDKETKLDEKKTEIENLNIKAEELVAEQEKKLIQISNLSKEEASNIIMNKVKEDMSLEIATYIKDEEEKAHNEAKANARNILSLAIQKYAGETVSETTATTVSLPQDDTKGRIIGREGRNIRTIESLTGVDLIVDDTPDAVVISSFDPIRREIAKKSLEILVSDGRIHPARIEEVVERSRTEIEMTIREKGEEACFKAGIGKIHPDLVKLIGRLYFRTSYGQNVLEHSLETCFLAGKLASEIGENETLARRAGLLHDIGKAVDHEIEGSHVEIGVSLAKKYHEPKEVIDAIASHHEDVAPKSVIAVLVAAADALSSARPGARSDSLENYTKRLENLEEIANGVKGVQSSYAIQAGREIRVIVNPDLVDDMSTFKVAHEIKEQIEAKLQFPGTIKVTVIRETRASDVAK